MSKKTIFILLAATVFIAMLAIFACKHFARDDVFYESDRHNFDLVVEIQNHHGWDRNDSEIEPILVEFPLEENTVYKLPSIDGEINLTIVDIKDGGLTLGTSETLGAEGIGFSNQFQLQINETLTLETTTLDAGTIFTLEILPN